jgi:hypothetical protein
MSDDGIALAVPAAPVWLVTIVSARPAAPWVYPLPVESSVDVARIASAASGWRFVSRSLKVCASQSWIPLIRSSVKMLYLLYATMAASYLTLAMSPLREPGRPAYLVV